MVLVWMILSLMVARAEDTTPQQASLAALESTIPEWAARNAEIQTKVNQAKRYLEAGDFFKAYPHWANQPMLSLVFLRSVLNQLQEEELSLSLDQEYEQCSNCSPDVKAMLDSIQNEHRQHSQAYIGLQRQSIIQLFAALKSNSGLQELKLLDRRTLWQADFQTVERQLALRSESESDEHQAGQSALQTIGQHRASLIAFERELVVFLMSRDSVRLDQWFAEQFQQYPKNGSLRQHRAAFELATFYELVFEDGSGTQAETVQNAKNGYSLSLKELKDQFVVDSESESSEPLQVRLDRAQAQIQSIEALEQDNAWLKAELSTRYDEPLAHSQDLQSQIEKEIELSQENHQQEVLLAEKALEEARIKRQQEQAQLDAEIQDSIIRIREEVRSIRSDDQDVRTWIQDRIEFYDGELLLITEGLNTTLKRSSLSQDRQAELNSMYLRADELLNLIRSDRLELEVKAQRFLAPTAVDSAVIDAESEQSITQAKIDLQQAYLDSTLSREEEVYSLFRRIEQIKMQRRMLTKMASASAIASGRDDFWFELSSEFSEQAIHTEFWLAEMASTAKSVPVKALRLDILSRLIRQLGFLVVILVAWLVLRRNRLAVIRSIKRYVQSEWAMAWEEEQTDESYGQSTAYIVDCLFAFFMYLCLHDVYPLLALLVLTLEGVILWRWRRVLTAKPEADLKIIQTLFYFISLFYAYLFLNDISIVIMSADRLSELISFLIVVSLVPICIGTLLMWSEAAEQNTKHWVDGNRFFHWLEQHLSHALLRKMMWSFVGLGMLFYQVFVYLSLLIIESTGWFGKSLSDSDVRFTPKPESLSTAKAVFSDAELLYQRVHELQKVHQKIEEWSQSKTNGVIGIIGDLGAGKTTLLERIQCEPYPKQMLSPQKRLCEVDSLLQWLNQNLGLKSESDLVQAILNMKPSIIVIDRLNYFFLRGMHGYDALYELSRIMQATSHHHCWVVSIHLYSWNFLRSKATPFKTDVFYSTIHIGEMTVQKCIEWSESCAKAHNVTIDFSTLNSRYKTESFFNQLKKSYWRLLVDSSTKNPSTIRRTWIESLEYSEAERLFFVHFFTLKPTQTIEELPLTELFILSAILIHGRLTALEQSQSLNIDHADILHSCTSLENKGILTLNQDTYEIVKAWYPTVILTLQQKHMLVAS